MMKSTDSFCFFLFTLAFPFCFRLDELFSSFPGEPRSGRTRSALENTKFQAKLPGSFGLNTERANFQTVLALRNGSLASLERSQMDRIFTELQKKHLAKRASVDGPGSPDGPQSIGKTHSRDLQGVPDFTPLSWRHKTARKSVKAMRMNHVWCHAGVWNWHFGVIAIAHSSSAGIPPQLTRHL